MPPGQLLSTEPTAGLVTDIKNNAGAITDYTERWHHGEIISTAFVESTVNVVVVKRLAKKQPMQWSKKGAHRLLQTRTLDSTLRDLFYLVSGHTRQRCPGRALRCSSLSSLPPPTVLDALPPGSAGPLMRFASSYARRSGARSLCCGRRRAIHVQWIAALRDILAVA
jgi:hypothetical protein